MRLDGSLRISFYNSETTKKLVLMIMRCFRSTCTLYYKYTTTRVSLCLSLSVVLFLCFVQWCLCFILFHVRGVGNREKDEKQLVEMHPALTSRSCYAR